MTVRLRSKVKLMSDPDFDLKQRKTRIKLRDFRLGLSLIF